MMRYLAIHVRVHEGRFHGDGDDPPSPFRLFQALVAGAGISGPLDDQAKTALVWLERLPEAPIIAAPRIVRGQTVSMFVPNNDLDAKGGDARRIGEIRLATKVWRPRLFDAGLPWIYAWPFEEANDSHAAVVCTLAEKLYQFGRGVDMAWAWGEILDETSLGAMFAEYEGVVWRPSGGTEGPVLACPHVGSIESLERRHRSRRFRTERGRRVFVQPPKPSHRQLAYGSSPARYIYELRSATDTDLRVAWPLAGASSLVLAARTAAQERLNAAMLTRTDEIDRYLVGRKPDGSNAAPLESRVRIVPVPSIGIHYVDRQIRRLLVEVPAACPLRGDDVRWAFSGLVLPGEPERILVPAADLGMLEEHYAPPSRLWRTVTAAALPQSASRRRIDPEHRDEQAKGGTERADEEKSAAFAVRQALRHADISAPVVSIRVQREPFDAKGERAEAFACPPRFTKERLWHVEITFQEPVSGPIVLGDGRYFGLGVMAPAAHADAVFAFAVTGGLAERPDPLEISVAMRRATMARVQRHLGGEELPPFFSGHEAGGGPAQTEGDPHLLFLFDAERARILVVAPHLAERRSPRFREREHLATLARALSGLRELRAGGSGRLSLRPTPIDIDTDPLFAPSSVWESRTTYQVTRHAHKTPPDEVLAADIRAECLRRGLPEPQVAPLGLRGVPGVGLVGGARLTFAVAVPGPLLLGRSRHRGGGLFAAAGQG